MNPESDDSMGSNSPPPLSQNSFVSIPGCTSFPLIYLQKEPGTTHGFLSTEEENQRYIATHPNYNVAYICGKSSGNLAVLDYEIENDAFSMFDRETILRSTLVVQTCHKGVHVYFRTIDKCPRRQTKLAGKDHPFDICGEGGYVVAPPSVIDHSLCDPKKERCPHTGKSMYHIVSKTNEIQLVTELEQSVRKKLSDLGWDKGKKSVELGLSNYQDLFEKALAKDEKLNELYRGNWEKVVPKTRSEAEFVLVLNLVRLGFPDEFVFSVMDNSLIGKWTEKEESYKRVTIQKARLLHANRILSQRKQRPSHEDYPI